MNNFSKPISKGDHVVVSMKENQFYFKLALDHLVCMMKLNYFLKDNTFDSKGGLEVKRIIEKTLSMNAAEEQEEISKESESGRFQSAIELSSISSSSLPADDGEMSYFGYGHAMDVIFICDDEEKDGIHELAKSKKTQEGKHKTATTKKKGKLPSQQTIHLVPSGSLSSSGQQIIRSPQKRGKFIRTGGNKRVSNVYSIRIKHSEFLLVFAEDGRRQFIYSFPGTQMKAWCTAFERDLRQEQAWPAGESPILNIVKRRDVRDETGDTPLAQINAAQYDMHAYLCYIGPDDTPASISEQIVAKINEYASANSANMKHFKYWHEITDGLDNEELHSLDYWVITRDIVDTVNDAYDVELNSEEFYNYPRLIEGLFERPENTASVRATLAGMTFRGSNV